MDIKERKRLVNKLSASVVALDVVNQISYKIDNENDNFIKTLEDLK